MRYGSDCMIIEGLDDACRQAKSGLRRLGAPVDSLVIHANSDVHEIIGDFIVLDGDLIPVFIDKGIGTKKDTESGKFVSYLYISPQVKQDNN